jgi:peptide methionine sulfoxide reductase msrA/msrB
MYHLSPLFCRLSIPIAPLALVVASSLLPCPSRLLADDREATQNSREATQNSTQESASPPENAEEETLASAVLGGGCFWCVESDFEKLPGVKNVISGYSGGKTKNPIYKTYAAGGHREVVFVLYDPSELTYAGLVEWLIKHVNPTDRGGSFQDRGAHYRPTIYYETEEERQAAERVISTIDGWRVFRSKINIALEPRAAFWPAEEYHQDYHHKQGIKYQFYRAQSGRDTFVMDNWGPRSGVLEIPGAIPDRGDGAMAEDKLTTGEGDAAEQPHWLKFKPLAPIEIRKRLNPMQYHVAIESGTEPAFNNRYWNHKEEGIYVDVLSGAPLFSATDKFNSGTGWPSFTKPMLPEYLVYHEERSPVHGLRIEVRSRISNIHLGHVFSDGPPLAGGKRYCMNSAALRFVPKSQMEREGYGDFVKFLGK